jgi:hypothetical protein
MQDQMRFEDEDGTWFISISLKFLQTIQVNIKNMVNGLSSIIQLQEHSVGSPPTPYIWDDTCRPEDAAEQIKCI